MKTTTININELETFMRLIKSERDLAVRLHSYNEQQKLQLKRLEQIKVSAHTLSIHKNQFKEWYKLLDPELKKIVERYKQR